MTVRHPDTGMVIAALRQLLATVRVELGP